MLTLYEFIFLKRLFTFNGWMSRVYLMNWSYLGAFLISPWRSLTLLKGILFIVIHSYFLTFSCRHHSSPDDAQISRKMWQMLEMFNKLDMLAILTQLEKNILLLINYHLSQEKSSTRNILTFVRMIFWLNSIACCNFIFMLMIFWDIWQPLLKKFINIQAIFSFTFLISTFSRINISLNCQIGDMKNS